MRHRHFLRLLLTSLLSLSILLTWCWTPFFFQAPAALAHAFVVGSDPVDGSTISAAPKTIRIFFNEDISPASIAHIYVFAPGGSPDGRLVDGGRSTIPANNARELDTPLLSPSTLPQGSYEVRWTAVATNDGHATHGLIGFNVGFSVSGLSGTPILGPVTSNTPPQLNLQGILAIMWEWLTAFALTFWIGIVVMEGLLLLGVGTSPDDSNGGIIASLLKQGRPLHWLCLAALLIGETINLILRGTLLTQALSLSGIDLAALRQLVFETSYGHLWLIRIGLICLALIFLWRTTRGQNETHEQTRLGASSQIRAGSRLSKLRREVAQVAADAEEQGSVQEDTSKPDSMSMEVPPSTQSTVNANVDAINRVPANQAEDAINRTPTGQACMGVINRTPARQSNVDAINRVPTSVPRWHTIAWFMLAGLILLTIAFSGDTVQLAQQHSSAVVLNWLQMIAQGIWFGGAAYLGFVLLPLVPAIASDHHGELLVNVLRSITPLLLAALGALLISMLFLIETTISDASQWLNDPYGRALLVNILLLVLMLIFTGYSFFYLLPKLRRQIILLPVVNADLPARRTRRSVLEQTGSSLKRAMHILAVLGAGVLLCAAIMDFFAPPIVFPPLNIASISSFAHPANAQAIQTQQVGNLLVSLEVTPAQADTTNTVIVTLKDNSGNPVTDAHIHISTNMEVMDMGTTPQDLLAQGGSSTYVAVFNAGEAFSMSGVWDITLSIQRPNQASMQANFVVMVQ